jgi:hypothetical protein
MSIRRRRFHVIRLIVWICLMLLLLHRLMNPLRRAILGPTCRADQVTGGFLAVSPSTAEIDLTWNDVPNVDGFTVFRGEQPDVRLARETSFCAESKSNHYMDNRVNRGTQYYYVIMALKGNSNWIAATGSCTTPANDLGPPKY